MLSLTRMCFDGTSPALYVSLIVCVISRNGGCVLDLAVAASRTGEPRANGRVDCLDLLSLSTFRFSAALLFCSSLFFLASARCSTVLEISQLYPLSWLRPSTSQAYPRSSNYSKHEGNITHDIHRHTDRITK